MSTGTMSDHVRYETDGRIARITLDRPDRLNAISGSMPGSIRESVRRANADDDVHVVLLRGAGEAFCSGYDLVEYAERPGTNEYVQEMPWDPTLDYRRMKGNTDDYMSLWRSYKPVICQLDGDAIGGGSDIALCCDLIVMADDARIGYPPARVWGCPTTAMWVYRLGPERAKRMLLTGDLIDGREAKDLGLVYESVPADAVEEKVIELATRIARIPKNQLMMQKLLINQAYENMGLATTQTLATFFDGVTRHTPEGMAFKKRAEEVGFKQAVRERDGSTPIDELYTD